ncbi:NAD(P)H-dependent flavin oxidoreductase [Planctomycetota bacterium]
MRIDKFNALKIGNLQINLPIIQGGMGIGISLSGLARAVATAGGIGVIATAGIGHTEADWNTNPKAADRRVLQKEIQKAKAGTDGIIGVNIMVALSNFDDLVQCAVDERADILFLGAGLPISLPKTLPLDKLNELATRFAPIVSSARAAEIVFKAWQKRYSHVPDAVVVEGPMAGGHLGFKKDQIDNPDYALEKILPEVIGVVKPYEQRFGRNIPVIAGGGIYTGADIHKFMKLGAQAVQMGTRFVATHECDASGEFKQAYIDCSRENIIIIDSPVGLPGRAIGGKFFDRLAAGIKETFRCHWKCLKSCNFRKAPYCIASALTNAKYGNFDGGFAFSGANAYRVDKIISVNELIETLTAEYIAEQCKEPITSGTSKPQRIEEIIQPL